MQRDKFRQLWFKSTRRLRSISALDHESDVAHRLTEVEPHVLEFFDCHRSVSPGGVGEQHAVPHNAAEDDEVMVAQSIYRHHERRMLDQIIQLKLSESDPSIAALFYVALQVKKGKSLTYPH